VAKVLFLAAGIYGVVAVSLHPPQFGPPTEMGNLAENLASTGSFSNPFFVLKTGPTAVTPPLYPFVLSILIRLLHNSNLVYIAAVIGCILANAFTAVLLPRISNLFYGDVIPGIIASVLWIPAMPLIPSYDVSYTIVGLIVFCLVAFRAAADQSHGTRFALVAGVIAAIVLLFNPATLLILAPWMLFLLWRGTAPIGTRVMSCCIIATLAALSIGGWGIRNYYRLGGFTVRATMGMTLYASNNNCAEVDIFRDQLYGCYNSHHPNTSLHEAELLRSLGEIQYDHRRISDTETWIRHHLRRFAVLTFWRTIAFWFPRTLPSATEILERGGYRIPEQVQGWITQRDVDAYVIRFITALSIPGLFIMAWRRMLITAYILAVSMIYPLMYYIVIADMRFRYPVLWLSLLPAGYFAYHLIALRPRPRKN